MTSTHDAHSIFWWGINVASADASAPGHLELQGRGNNATWHRDRHTTASGGRARARARRAERASTHPRLPNHLAQADTPSPPPLPALLVTARAQPHPRHPPPHPPNPQPHPQVRLVPLQYIFERIALTRRNAAAYRAFRRRKEAYITDGMANLGEDARRRSEL
jgi:hypothetical protein